MSEWSAETAEWYADKYGEYPTNRLTIESLELAANARVLDIGCGTGAALRHTSAKVTEGLLVGVDPVPRMVEIAREKVAQHSAAARIQIQLAPAHELPFEAESFDVVLALDSYDHWGAQQAAGLLEVRRVLAPRGRFVVVKDESVPTAAEAKVAFQEGLRAAGFSASERQHETPEVSFTTWICTAD